MPNGSASLPRRWQRLLLDWCVRLERHGLPVTEDAVERIFARAKASNHTLSDDEIRECLAEEVKG